MQFLRRPGRQRQPWLTGCVATIGVFDGVHVGHQRILARVLAEAARRDLPSLVFTFDPTPQEVLVGRTPPARLMRLRDKVADFRSRGIDAVFCPPFDAAMSALKPDEFIDRYLIDLLRARHVVVGDDFRFAHQRSGTFAHLEAAGRRLGFGVEQVGSFVVDGVRVSSTAVRQALAAGDLPQARRLLGRPFRISGRVVHGRRLGRELGFATANINLHRRESPVEGVFAVRVAGVTDTLRDALVDGVASVGTRPTIAGGLAPLLEVHLFDRSLDLYGRRLGVDFIARLRGEVRFPDLDSLKRQMVQDAAAARRALQADAAIPGISG